MAHFASAINAASHALLFALELLTDAASLPQKGSRPLLLDRRVDAFLRIGVKRGYTRSVCPSLKQTFSRSASPA